jgi:hypothetical protein
LGVHEANSTVYLVGSTAEGPGGGEAMVDERDDGEAATVLERGAVLGEFA